MKKLIFMILSLGILFTSGANADGYCQNWEHGEIVEGGEQPNGSTAPKPFCWQVSKITGGVIYDGQLYSNVELEVSGYSNSYYNFVAFMKKDVYGEEHYGTFVEVEVYGLPQNQPSITLQGRQGIFLEKVDFNSLSGDIYNGTTYKFYVPRATVAQAEYLSDIDLNSRINIYDGGTLKDKYPFTVY